MSVTVAQEIIVGWREGRPVLDSLGDEQMVVADAFDALAAALHEIADNPHGDTDLAFVRGIARKALS